jgi:hypothetical protein
LTTLINYSTHNCSVYQATAAYDSRITGELALAFLNEDLHNSRAYQHYRQTLLQQYSLKKNLYLPTYIRVSDPESDTQIIGEITGAPAEDALRSLLEALIGKLPPEEQRPDRLYQKNMMDQGGDKSI